MFFHILKSLKDFLTANKAATKEKTLAYEIVTSTVADADHIPQSEITAETIIMHIDNVAIMVSVKSSKKIRPEEGMTVRTLVEKIS